jgi:hypothetical protein
MPEGITIVTAASSNHFRSLLQFLGTVPEVRIVVYDIGLSQYERDLLPSRAIVRTFHFDLYPAFLRLSAPDSGAYAWKPVIVYDVCREFGGVVIWCDAGNKLYTIHDIVHAAKTCGVYSAVSLGPFRGLTHPVALGALPGSNAFLDRPMRNAACVAIDWSNPKSQYIVHDWKTLALRKEISLPDGATRLNHRHDQSILTYLIYAYGMPTIDAKVGHTIHNDIG